MLQTDLQHGFDHNSLNSGPIWTCNSSKPAGFATVPVTGTGMGQGVDTRGYTRAIP
jgi:hypothetical protein